MSDWQPVFIAGNTREIDAVEELLEAEGIEYEVTPEAFMHAIGSEACFQGLQFSVLGGQAAYCRDLLERKGFVKGVIPPIIAE